MTDANKPLAGLGSELRADQARILALEPQDALYAILDHPRAGALVHGMPEEDLYVLVHEIGPDDCMEILAMASPAQWQYFLDMDCWRDDLPNFSAVNDWLSRLFHVNADRLSSWLANDERDFFEFWLNAHALVVSLNEHEDPSDLPEDFFSLDGSLHLKLISPPGLTDSDREKMRALLSGLLKHVADQDFHLYQALVMESSGVLSAETREKLFRMRNTRLAEHGFAPAHEAAAVYQHLSADELLAGPQRILPKGGFESPAPQLLLPAPEGESSAIFSEALALVPGALPLWALQSEFAGLANLIISADRLRVRSRDDLREPMRKAAGFISLGLELLSGKNAAKAAEILAGRPLDSIFRVGYSRVLDVKFKAERFRKIAWFTKQNVPLTFFGERFLGVLGGLLLARPKFFANYEKGLLYREFESVQDIEKTSETLSEIMEVDRLFSNLALPVGLVTAKAMTWSKALLTAFAQHRLRLSFEAAPIPMEDFRKFYAKLWTGRGRNRAISSKTKDAFVAFILRQTADSYEKSMSPALARTFEDLFSTINNEYAKVSVKNLDPRFLPHFWVN